MARQAEVLRGLGRQTMTLIEMRRSVAGRDSFIARRRTIEQRLGEAHLRLRLSEAHWRGLFERLNEGLVIGEVVRDSAGQAVDWRYLDVNPAWGELVGVDPAHVVGRTVRDAFPDIEEDWIRDFAQVVATGEPAAFTRRIGALNRWYEGRAFPLDDDRFAVLFLEVTDRIHVEVRRNALLDVGDQLRNLATAEDMARTATAIVGRALGVTRAGFGRLDANNEHVTVGPDWTAPDTPSIAGRHRFADWGDFSRELLLGEPLVIRDTQTDLHTAADRQRWAKAQIRALVNIPIQERGRTVAVFIVQDSKPRAWTPETIAFLRNVADRLTAGVARLKAEADQRLLNQELSHRMKNMLAIVQGIATQTLKGVAERDAVVTFEDRLQALSTAHEVLLQTHWSATTLHELAEAVLARSGDMRRIGIGGPRVTLGPRTALSASMLLHELATNATKYGALSVADGRVAVAWHVDHATGELVLTWTESDGPPAVEPVRKGFGSRLIRSGLSRTGGVALRYLPTGLEA
jgi:two-component sensor histidine kinase/PAS domain-containing protein